MSETTHHCAPLVSGARIFLSGLEESDLPQIHAWKNDLDLANQILARPVPSSRTEVESWYRTNQVDKHQVLLGIRLSEGPELLGLARLMFIDTLAQHCELGLWIGSQARRGSGLGSEALRLVLSYAFVSLNLRRVHLRVRESNAAAIACYRAAGFREEGKLREHAWVAGKYENIILMGLLRNEHS
jgi:RimJ/RimL family protein N-acetyltransferase